MNTQLILNLHSSEEVAYIKKIVVKELTKFRLNKKHYNILDFPTVIKNKRAELGETGTEFGKRFGVTHSSVSDWENGKAEAGYEVLNFVLSKPVTKEEL
jgi:DNA-binding transcriptional regulator YiaG